MLLFFILCLTFLMTIFLQKKKVFGIVTVLFISNIVGGCSTVVNVKRLYHTPTCAINSRTITLKKDQYYLHREAGEQLPGITLAHNRTQQRKLIQKEVLVSIKNQGYSVQKMNYGTPYVHKEMQSILTELQTRFEEKQKEKALHNIDFVITSAYRTTSDQKRLQKINRNATKKTSSHSYGASVDIAKLAGKSCKQAVPLFQEVLTEMQTEKKIYLCPESNTIHITARVK